MTPNADEYNWLIIVLGKGDSLDAPTGPSLMELSDATYGTGTPDSGSKMFHFKPGRPYYAYAEVWHCSAQIAISEKQ